jgi:hypothetical protein
MAGLERLGADLIGTVSNALLLRDLFALQQTSKGLRDMAAASGQWDRAAGALEAEFPPPLPADVYRDGERTREQFSAWRVQHDPRAACTEAEWRALPPQRRFAAMVPLCRRLVVDLQAACVFNGAGLYFDDWEFPHFMPDYERHVQVYHDFCESGAWGDIAELTVQSCFECHLRSAKDISYQSQKSGGSPERGYSSMVVEDILVDTRSYRGNHDLPEAFYPPNCGSFQILPGTDMHVYALLHPPLPFTVAERRMLGTDFISSMCAKLEVPQWYTPPKGLESGEGWDCPRTHPLHSCCCREGKRAECWYEHWAMH